MDAPSQSAIGRDATCTRGRIAVAARTLAGLILATALLLVLIAWSLGVTEVGPTGLALLAIAAALVSGYVLRLAWPVIVRFGRRIPVRFGLRTMLILMLVGGVGLAWLGNKARDMHRQRQILRQIGAGGFSVGLTDWYSEWMPRWVYRRFGLYGPIATGSLDHVGNSKTIRDENLRALTELRFGELSLNFSNVNDEQLGRVQLPPNLKCFAAQGTALGDRSLEHLAQCQSLEAIELYGTQVTDEGISNLKQLPNLYMLGLEKTQLTDASIEHLKQLRQLRVLRIWQTQITPTAMDELRKSLPECLIVDDFRKTTQDNYFYWPEKKR